jgi:hypothetical protein
LPIRELVHPEYRHHLDSQALQLNAESRMVTPPVSS